MTLDRQAEVEAWLREHEPTRCPVAAVGVTTATISAADVQWLHSLPPPQKAKGRKQLPFHERPVSPPAPPQAKVAKIKKIKPREDLVGKIFGKLTVIGPAPSSREGVRWLCQCECGAQKPIRQHYLKSGWARTCGCRLRPPVHGSRVDLTGKKFGILTVLNHVPNTNIRSGYMWLCQCECGNKKAVRGYDIKRGKIKSCGCRAGPERSRVDEVGKRYGPIVVLSRAPSSPDHKAQRRWAVRCDCGDEFIASTNALHRYFKTEGCSGQHRAWHGYDAPIRGLHSDRRAANAAAVRRYKQRKREGGASGTGA